LDTTTRKLRIDEFTEVLISDTVGFIRKLPHHLIEAFKATLEELSYADVLLHVIDISNPDWEEQARVVDSLINQLGANETPCIRVYNKCDAYVGILPHGEDIVCLSAKSGEGVQELVQALSRLLDKGRHHVTLKIPYSSAGTADLLNREAAVIRMEYTDEGIEAEVIAPPDIFGKVKRFIPGYTEAKEDWED
ncbi:MAG: GTPase, partial [Oscillospiraceae bacterium]